MLTLVSMVAKNGCKFSKIKSYSFSEIKGHDICIFDLDNLGPHINEIKADVPKMSEIVMIGISRSDDMLDMFRPLINVEKKPFFLDVFLQYKSQVMEEVGGDYIVNKDAERVYDSLGVKISDLLNEQTLSNEELLDKLKEKIDSSPAKIEPESEFLNRIGLSDIPIPEPEKTEVQPPAIFNPFEDNALLMYRTRKLRSMNLTPMQIELKLKELTSREFSPEKTSPQTSELLAKLKSGYFSTKKKQQKASPPVPPPPKQKEITPPKEIIHKPEVEKPTIPITEVPQIPESTLDDIDKKYEIPAIEKTSPKEIQPVIEKIDSTIKPAEKIISSLPKLEPLTSDIPQKEDLSKLDVKLTPEKEALLIERMAKLNRLRGKTVTKPSPPPIVPSPPPVTVEDIQEEPEDEIDKRYYLPEESTKLIDSAAIKLGGKAPSHKKNITDDETVKDSKDEDLRKEMPRSSLLDLIKTRVSGIEPQEDLVAKRKKEIEQKIKPPAR